MVQIKSRQNKNHTKVFLFTALDTRDLNYASVICIYPSCLTINKMNKYTLDSTDESKSTLRKYEELGSKIKDNYYEEYMKIKFNSHDDLTLKKTLELYGMVIVLRSVFMRVINTFHKFFYMTFCINLLKCWDLVRQK